MWIPTEEKRLRLRILIAAQKGPGGHRGWTTTLKMSAKLVWKGLAEDVKNYVAS